MEINSNILVTEEAAPQARPTYHLAPTQGWLNDPNGPFYHNGKYHMFYQHLASGCEWAFGLGWGHAVSEDLINWRQLPMALTPGPEDGTYDLAGCFSGCAAVDVDGNPMILYTGVRLRTDTHLSALPPPDQDLNLPFIEAQLRAMPVLDEDGDLVSWTKDPTPAVLHCPPGMKLTGWRDPFVIERPSSLLQYCMVNGSTAREQPAAAPSDFWRICIGSGIKDVGGAVLIYRTKDLRKEWEYEGLLAMGDGSTGNVWECPLIASLPVYTPPTRIDATTTSRRSSVAGSSPACKAPAAGAAGNASADAADAAAQHQREVLGFNLVHPANMEDARTHHPSPLESCDIDADVLSCADELKHSPAASPRRAQPAESGSSENGANGASGATPPAPDSSSFSFSTWASPLQQAQEAAAAAAAAAEAAAQPPTHFLSISPDACTNPTLYYLGSYADGKFDLSTAIGPYRMDLGDIFYAPNIMADAKGRILLWAWLQESRRVGVYDYAGCLSVPRVLSVHGSAAEGWRLHQEPLPELTELRSGAGWQAIEVALPNNTPVDLPATVSGAHLDLQLTLRPGSAPVAGLLLRSWEAGQGGAALLFNWHTSSLEVVYEALDPATMQFSLGAPGARQVGGRVEGLVPGEVLHLRVLLDHSCVEAFTHTGAALAVRVNRGSPPPGCPDPNGLSFVAMGGDCTLAAASVHEMRPMWQQEAVVKEMVADAAAKLKLAAAAAAIEKALGGAEEHAAAGMRASSSVEKELELLGLDLNDI